MVAFLFPGQGSQAVGMGQAICESSAEARQTFEEADDALGFSLSQLCFSGPEEDLKRTENTQPAILTASIALHRALLAKAPELSPTIVAGHSLGEWSALVSVGALGFADAVKAVRARGQLMQAAVPEGVGAMSAVMGLDADKIVAICKSACTDDESVSPANFNSSAQIVVSGHAAAVERANAAFTEAGAKKVVPLAVSAPFHCALMKPAADGLDEVLERIEIHGPSAPVVSNVDAAPNADRTRIKELLVAQVTSPVRWVECVQAIVASGETVALELGRGNVLRGLARRIDKSLEVHGVADPASLDKALAALG